MISKKQIVDSLKKSLESENKQEVSSADLEQFLSRYDGWDRIDHSINLEEEVRKNGIRKGMTTGVNDLDSILGGFYEDQVIVVVARPKSGKTSFALYLTEMMEQQSPLFLALEQSPRELIEQMVERNIKIPFFYTPRSTENIDKTTDWIHLKIVESQYRSVKDNRQPTKLVLIDHFGYVTRRASSDQVTWSIIGAMQDLKQIAKQTKTAIVIIVHTTKGDPLEAPTTEDLFGSAGYHQEADTVLSLWRETYKEDKKICQTNNVLLQVLANRKKGVTGAIKFQFNNGRFNRIDWVDHAGAKADRELNDWTHGL